MPTPRAHRAPSTSDAPSEHGQAHWECRKPSSGPSVSSRVLWTLFPSSRTPSLGAPRQAENCRGLGRAGVKTWGQRSSARHRLLEQRMKAGRPGGRGRADGRCGLSPTGPSESGVSLPRPGLGLPLATHGESVCAEWALT